jgi:hypothetical protein
VAERIVNVVINYRVNTAEVLRAQKITEEAQKATDNLRKSTEQYGKAATDANKQAVAGTRANITALNDLYSTVKLVLAGGIVKEIVTANLEMAKLSGNIEGVTKAFSRLPNATLLLEDLRKVTRGTVTDLELMQKTLMAQNYRIPLKNLGTLLEFAAAKAQQTGQEVNHLINYIVTGIGLRSIKRLDDLGFTANRVKEALGGVSLQAASMGEVMDAVAKLMNEDLKQTGGFAETSKTKVEQLERAWHDMRVEASKFFTSPSLLKFYDFVLSNFTAGLKVINGTFEDEAARQRAIKEVQDFKEMQMSEEVLKNKQKALDIVQQEINTRVQLIGRNNDEIKEIKAAWDAIANSGKRVSYEEDKQLDTLKEQNTFYVKKNLTLRESIKILKEYLKSLNGLPTESEVEEERDIKTDSVKFFESGKPKTLLQKSLERQMQALLAQASANISGGISVPVAIKPEPFIPTDDQDRIADWWAENWRGVLSRGIDSTVNFLMEVENAEINHLQRLLDSKRAFYDKDSERKEKPNESKGR